MSIDHATVENFKTYLTLYESGVIHNTSGRRTGRAQSGPSLKDALRLLVSAGHSEVFLMMGYFTQQIRKFSSSHYSESTISELIDQTINEGERRLLKNILEVTFKIVHQREVILDEIWLAEIGGNVALQLYLIQHGNLPAPCEETYSGNLVTKAGGITTTETDASHFLQRVSEDMYVLRLQQDIVQIVDFGYDDSVPSDQNHLSVEVLITPKAGCFILGKSVHFIDDARAQLQANDCIPGGYVRGEETLIALPKKMSSAVMLIATYNGGTTWLITEFNILPPSIF